MPNMVPPIIHPIKWYMHIACIIVTMTPPRKRNERRWLKSDTALKLPKTPVEYRAACVRSSGYTAAKWWMPGPEMKPKLKAITSNHMICTFSELYGLRI